MLQDVETGTTVTVYNSVDDPKPDDQTMDFAHFFTKSLPIRSSKNSMHSRYSRGGIPEADSVEGVRSVTGREIPSAVTYC